MNDALRRLKPSGFWRFFDEITAIPRESRNERKIAEYIEEFAKARGLGFKRDAVGNVCIKKKASPGYESRRGIVLQGHLDMVCEKRLGSSFDFGKDPIKTVIKGEWVHADGTTLGADDGVAIALALAIMDDDGIEHGPLEGLFTVEEETGLVGATNLDPAIFDGVVLVNLDSEGEGLFTIGCAGGLHTKGKRPVGFEPVAGGSLGCAIRLEGFKGGHSGMDIDKGLGNAAQTGIRFLAELRDGMAFGLCAIEGGDKHNAIPRDFSALISIDPADWPKVEEKAGAFEAALRRELGKCEPDFVFKTEKSVELPAKRISQADRDALIDIGLAMPHGAIAYSQTVPGLVETSTNFASVKIENGAIRFLTSQRSSVGSQKDYLGRRVEACMRMGGCETEKGNYYPAWTPNPDAPLLKRFSSVYRRVTGKEPRIAAMHAGLECGIIGEKRPGMQMIAIGPELEGVHSPDERLNIESVGRLWTLLLEALKTLD